MQNTAALWSLNNKRMAFYSSESCRMAQRVNAKSRTKIKVHFLVAYIFILK